jgi:hypothetical protein
MQAKAAESRDARSIVTAFAWTARSSSMYFFASKNRGFPITAAKYYLPQIPVVDETEAALVNWFIASE